MNNIKKKICGQCKKEFIIKSNDAEFYDRMRIHAPTICGRCGVERMMSFRNERILYKRICDRCQKTTLSLYHPKTQYVVYCHECWWSDAWDATTYAVSYDGTKTLEEQYKLLQYKVPREALIIVNSTNCEYSNNCRDSKNCYLCFLLSGCEEIYYSMWMVDSKECIDGLKQVGSELCGYNIDTTQCSRGTFLTDSGLSVDCHFSYGLKGCNDCIFCWNLRNKSYCIENKQYSKEEYEVKKKEILDGSYQTLQQNLAKLRNIKERALRCFINSYKSVDVSGNYLLNCGRSHWCFDGVSNEDVMNVASILNAKQAAYGYAIGTQPSEFSYGMSVMKGGAYNKCSYNLFLSHDCAWSDSLVSCGSCIASIGLKHKEYCILNKQYTKEEYERIVKELYSKGELQDLPEAAFGTFGYNETAAQDYYPMTRDEAIAHGYTWQEDVESTKGQETIVNETLPDNIVDVNEGITKEILRCIRCTKNYRIVPGELALLKRLNIPLPRECPRCRLEARKRERLPFMLWPRKCMCEGDSGTNAISGISYKNTAKHFHGSLPCSDTFETAYSPDRREVVYCEACYQQEVV